MDKCPSCPVADRPGACLAQATGHARLCGLVAAGRDDSRTLVLAHSGAAPPAPSPTPNPALEAMRARLTQVQACPHWRRGTADDACGCGEAVCGLGKGRRGHVKRDHCFECLGLA